MSLWAPSCSDASQPDRVHPHSQTGSQSIRGTRVSETGRYDSCGLGWDPLLRRLGACLIFAGSEPSATARGRAFSHKPPPGPAFRRRRAADPLASPSSARATDAPSPSTALRPPLLVLLGYHRGAEGAVKQVSRKGPWIVAISALQFCPRSGSANTSLNGMVLGQSFWQNRTRRMRP